MSLDRFASHSVQQAVLMGDVESDVGFVLSFLPKTLQDSSLRQMKLLPTLVTAEQLVRGIEHKAVNLAKTDFDKSHCLNCLHNTSNSNRYAQPGSEFKPHHCLFALCAQHDAMDDSLLAQRTVLDADVTADLSFESVTPDDSLNAQMDIGEPDLYEETFGLFPDDQEPATDQLPLEELRPIALEKQPAETTADEIAPAITEAVVERAVEAPAAKDSYVDYVKNAWWRSALSQRITEHGNSQEMLNFLVANMATQSVRAALTESPTSFFTALSDKDADETVVSLATMVIDELPMEVVQSFLRSMNVDLTLSGHISVKLLSALDLEELSGIADQFSVPNTDALCDAYDAGPQAFAHAIAAVIGDEALAAFIPPSLRP